MRKNKILLPVLTIVLCAVVIVTVCIVMLTRGEDGTHIIIEGKPPEVSEGTLEISLVRERLETMTISERNGLLVKHTEEKQVDFSKSNKNIFGIDTNILIGPSCWFQADMAISNTTGDPFEYWLEIVPIGGETLLTDQLELTVQSGGETVIRRTLTGGLSTRVIGRSAGGDVSRFTARLEYLNVTNNDDTKNLTLTFDMTVHARLV